tara:strand:- start:189 stop:422 length:234 start_codon:yes stop_codon:yes gene_type:complete
MRRNSLLSQHQEGGYTPHNKAEDEEAIAKKLQEELQEAKRIKTEINDTFDAWLDTMAEAHSVSRREVWEIVRREWDF